MPEIPARREQAAAPPQPDAGQSGQNHQQADANHGAEGEERWQDRRTIIRWKVLEAGKQTVPAVGEEKRSTVWNGHRKFVRFGPLGGPREQHELARSTAVPVRLDGRDLRRLIDRKSVV